MKRFLRGGVDRLPWGRIIELRGSRRVVPFDGGNPKGPAAAADPEWRGGTVRERELGLYAAARLREVESDARMEHPGGRVDAGDRETAGGRGARLRSAQGSLSALNRQAGGRRWWRWSVGARGPGDERSEEHCQREERYDPRAAKAFETCLGRA